VAVRDERVYFAYIVASRSLTLYIGMTGDLRTRVLQHKKRAHEGFSATYNCNRLVWFERFATAEDAIAREKQLKGWIRAKKIALIVKGNPGWSDLSEGWYGADPTVDKRGKPLRRG
jgi:putative endonuclease